MAVDLITPTRIHVPKPLLQAVDRRARTLGIGRNQLIQIPLEREVMGGFGWSPGFFERFESPDAERAAAVDAMLADVLEARRSKGPPSP